MVRSKKVEALIMRMYMQGFHSREIAKQVGVDERLIRAFINQQIAQQSMHSVDKKNPYTQLTFSHKERQ